MKSSLLLPFLFFIVFSANSQQVSTIVPGPSSFNDGLAIDRYGNIFASRYFDDEVTKITPSGQTSIFANGFSDPNGLIFDSRGYLWVPEANGDQISILDTTGSVDSVIIIDNPAALKWDPDSNLIVADYTNNRISIIDSAGNISSYWTDNGELNGPIGLEFDSSGNFYMGNFTDGRIFRRDLNDSVIQIADLPGNMGFMTLAGGHLYATAFTVDKIYKIALDGSSTTIFSGTVPGGTDGHVSQAQFNEPNGITSTKTGDTLYISEYAPRRLRMITGILNPTMVSLEEKELFENITFFPNPARDEIQFSIPSEINGDLKLKLFSIKGELVFESQLKISDFNKIQLSDKKGNLLERGYYILKMNIEGNQISRPLVISK